jgi:hypothetical protein
MDEAADTHLGGAAPSDVRSIHLGPLPGFQYGIASPSENHTCSARPQHQPAPRPAGQKTQGCSLSSPDSSIGGALRPISLLASLIMLAVVSRSAAPSTTR